jgi:N-acetylmuramoyl-L-alanine amidase
MKTHDRVNKSSQLIEIAAETIKAVFFVCAAGALLATLFTSIPATGFGSEITIFNQDGIEISLAVTQTPPADFHVGLVVGHWGNDSGAICSDSLGGYREVDINHVVADETRKLLESYGIQVDLLKEFDDRLGGFQAQALVSIHADTCEYTSDDATGYKIAEARGNQRPDQAARLLNCLKTRYGQATTLRYDANRITRDMTEYHAFSEIDPNTPAVIIETGYMNLDQKLLVEEPQIAAQGIADGILCYLYREPINIEE